MTDWPKLTHAYGPAGDIPALLEQAGPAWSDPSWDELWSRLCHQGTVYSASFAALPALTRKARSWSAVERTVVLILAGAITASTDRVAVTTDPRVTYAAEIAELADLTEQSLRRLTHDPTTYVYVLQALLGFQGVPVWGQQLDALNDEEFELTCPHCATELFVIIDADQRFATNDDAYMNNPDAKQSPLTPATTMEDIGGDLHQRALADGQPTVAEKLTYVFGNATCVECNRNFNVAEAVEARWT